MKCNIEWLSAYLDGALAEEKRAKLEEHLKTCEACTSKLEEFARVEQAAKKIPAPQLSEAYWENFASRVQNKLTIREKQKTSPAWLEALKSFFQPTTGKLAIAGSVAVIILLTFVSLDQWKKETFRPPVFDAEKPVVEGKVDSVQNQAKDESSFRMARTNENKAVADKKRENRITSAKAAEEGILDSRKNAPAALAPPGRALAAPERQKTGEEPSLAAFAERDEAVKGDTVVVTAGRKAEIRKEVATSQVRVAKEDTGKPASRNIMDLLKTPLKINFQDEQGDIPRSTSRTSQDTARKHGSAESDVQEFTSIKSGFDAQYGGKTMPPIDTAQEVSDIRQIITEKEKELKGDLSKSEIESLYIYLAQYYVQLYRFSLVQDDWKKADQRIANFLKTDLSESNRRWLVAIQSELKKLKK